MSGFSVPLGPDSSERTPWDVVRARLVEQLQKTKPQTAQAISLLDEEEFAALENACNGFTYGTGSIAESTLDDQVLALTIINLSGLSGTGSLPRFIDKFKKAIATTLES